MRKLLKKLKSDERGQGTAEYVLLLVIVIGLIIAFKGPITAKVNGLVEQITSGMDEASSR